MQVEGTPASAEYCSLLRLIIFGAMIQIKRRETIFKVFAVFFLITAIYHMVAVFFKINASSIFRNILFMVINLFCVYGLLKRPAYFVYLFCVLLVQQCFSHGKDLLNNWHNGKIDWISILVLVSMPVMLFYLIKDLKNKKLAKG